MLQKDKEYIKVLLEKKREKIKRKMYIIETKKGLNSRHNFQKKKQLTEEVLEICEILKRLKDE